jgi:hypothetical protein
MDYHLEPARYEKVVVTKLMARYELRVHCDWIATLQTALDATDTVESNVMNIEPMRSGLLSAHYNSTAGTTNDGTETMDAISEQWGDLIDVILRQTAWQAVSDTSGDYNAVSRRVDQNKVDAQMGYTAGVQGGAKSGIAAATNDLSKPVLGLKPVLATDADYNPEKLGDLINNTNMYEILEKLRSHGCFIVDEDKTDGEGFVVNPFIQEQSEGGDNTTSSQKLLDKGDELVFPINLKSIVGHTETTGATGDEDISKAFSLEINVTFKQSETQDELLGHPSNQEGFVNPTAPADNSGNASSTNVTNQTQA